MTRWPYYGGFAPNLLAINWSLCAVTFIQIVGRIIGTQILPRNRGGWSLVSACLAWLLSTISIVVGTYCMYYGLGNDLEQFVEIPISIISWGLYLMWISANLISYSSFFGRLSAALFMFDILGPTHKPGRWAILFILTINAIYYLVFTVSVYVSCKPTAKVWNPTLPGNCDAMRWAYDWSVFGGAWAALADASIALYPSYVLYHLQMRFVTKILIGGLMGLGLVAAICNVFKTIYLKDVVLKDVKSLYHFMTWGPVEAWVVLIASNFAPLYPLFRECAKKTRRMSSPNRISSVWLRRLSNSFDNNSEKPEINVSDDDSIRDSVSSGPPTITMMNNVIMKQTSFEVSFHERRESDLEAGAPATRRVNSE